MHEDDRIWLITADVGYKLWDDIAQTFTDRFINVGAAEQAAVNIAIGLASEDKIPFVYSITPFLLYRPFESIRNYIDREKIPVKLVGSGRKKDYGRDGFSHWAEEDEKIMALFSSIEVRYPKNTDDLIKVLNESLSKDLPFYINLKR